jgi:hypothetical protein
MHYNLNVGLALSVSIDLWLVYGMCWFSCTGWTRFLYWWISLRGQSCCRRIVWHFECQGIICLRLSCYSLSIYIAFQRAWSTEQYQSALLVGLFCWPLNRIPCLPELYYSVEIPFRNWFCLTEFDCCGSLDTVVSMERRRPTDLQVWDQILFCRAGALSSVGTFECQAEGARMIT